MLEFSNVIFSKTIATNDVQEDQSLIKKTKRKYTKKNSAVTNLNDQQNFNQTKLNQASRVSRKKMKNQTKPGF